MTIQEATPPHELVDSESGWQENEMDAKHEAPRYQDAFGDESNAEVKYKTMEWW